MFLYSSNILLVTWWKMLHILRLLSPTDTYLTLGPCEWFMAHVVLLHKTLT